MDIDPELGRRLIRAARSLSRLDVATFAKRLGVGEATVKRAEAGMAIRVATLRKMLAAMPEAGVSVTEPDPARRIGHGIALVADTPDTRGGGSANTTADRLRRRK